MEAGFEFQDPEENEFLMGLGVGQYGCSHYRGRCKIRAPCCGEVFDCRHCHDEVKDALEIHPLDRHKLPRHAVERVICSLCDTEQDVQQWCINCGVCMGKYFCSKCKFFDDDVSKKQYHCEECGICRAGGAENFFHCSKCECCYSKEVKETHVCREKVMHRDCPICCEFLFDSLKATAVLQCGHSIHIECLEMLKDGILSKSSHEFNMPRCPVCLKSYLDMSLVWEQFDLEVARTPLPPEYENKTVSLLCNDCEEASDAYYHVVGLKCLKCNSYNTRRTHGGLVPCSEASADVG